MRVLLINGSPKAKGNTAGALAEIAAVLEQQGIETKTFQLGGGPIRDCIGCGGCAGKGRCAFDDDVVNRLIEEAAQADGFVFGTPVYSAPPSGPWTGLSMPGPPPSERSRALPWQWPAAPVRRPLSTC